MKNLSEHSTDELLDIIQKVVAAVLRHLKISEEEVEEFTGQVKERKMGELFEHFKDCDLPAARKKAQEEGFREGHYRGHEEGLQEGRQKGLQEGRKEGQQAGEELLLIKLVCRKLAKNKEITQIATELEVNETDVEKICLTAKRFAPEYDPEQIQYALNNTDC